MARITAQSRKSQNLPANITPFVGRQQELGDLGTLLRDPDCRLVTVLGPGGIGKTRLVIEAADRAAERFADGVAYADVQAIANAEFLPEAVAETLGLQLTGDDTAELIVGILANKELLLVLDNFEHFLDASEFVSHILSRAPAVRCLVSSREVLNLQEEWLYPLRGLHLEASDNGQEVPRHASDAFELYVQCARRVRHNFDADANRDAILHICDLVEGSPLAIELAASWSRLLDAAAIAYEIEQGLDFLATGVRNVPDRHRSMHAAVEQSWLRLSDEERHVFAQLSVFQGGFRLRQAELVTGASLSLFASLVDRSLLRWEPDGRYTMHELLRQFGSERLAEAPDIEASTRDRHFHAYAEFLAERSNEIFGHRQNEVLEEIRPELANIQTALDWGMAKSDVETLDKLVIVYYQYCDARGHFKRNVDVLERVVVRLEEMKQTAAVLRSLAAHYALLAWCNIRVGALNRSIESAERSEAILTEYGLQPAPGFGTDPLPAMALAHHVLGQYDQALDYANKARQRDEASDDALNLMIADYVLCSVYLALNRLENALEHGLAASSLAEQRGNSWFQAYVLMDLGSVVFAQGDLVKARQYYQSSFELKEGVTDPEGMAATLNQLGKVALLEGEHREAARLHFRSLELYEQINDPGGRANTLHGLANAAAANGETGRAARTYRQALDLLREIGYWQRVPLVLLDVAALLVGARRSEVAERILRAVKAHSAADAAARRRAKDIITELGNGALYEGDLDSSHADADLAVLISDVLLTLGEVEAVDEEGPAADPVVAANEELTEPLTARELEVLQLLAEGMTNPDIAEELIISVGTVKSYTAQIYGKLAVNNRTQAVNRGRELGLLRH